MEMRGKLRDYKAAADTDRTVRDLRTRWGRGESS